MPLRPELSKAIYSSVEFPADLGGCLRIIALSDDLIGSYNIGEVKFAGGGMAGWLRNRRNSSGTVLPRMVPEMQSRNRIPDATGAINAG
jgi:hypothetical protein